jgi:NADH-quinone oxidoreductase subunit N
MLSELLPVFPEILLVLVAIALMMVGVYSKGDTTRTAIIGGVLALGAALFALAHAGEQPHSAFGGMFVQDGFTIFVKGLVLLATVLTLALSLDFLEREKIGRFEYPVLVLFATVGMMIMISAGDFMALYVGLELQSLSLYVLAAYQRDSSRATEAGLKYFVLGSLASGMLLYGISLIYGFAGTTQFSALTMVLGGEGGAKANIGVIAGMVFILAGLVFKISAAPFHMWTPDVYEGAPTPVTAFFAIGPKIAAFALLVRVLSIPFGDLMHQWQQVIAFVAVLSMIVGSFGAIVQDNIKRLMAYSSIGHVGFALVGVVAGGEAGIQGVLIYLAIYLFMNVGVFAIIMTMRRKGQMVEGIEDLAGLSKTSPTLAYVMTALMFSMAGIPPLAGFWGKFYVFVAAVQTGHYTLAIIGMLASVVSAYYYIRIIKIMFMDDAKAAFDGPISRPTGVVLVLSTAVVVLFTVFPTALLSSAKAAAQVLFLTAG